MKRWFARGNERACLLFGGEAWGAFRWGRCLARASWRSKPEEDTSKPQLPAYHHHHHSVMHQQHHPPSSSSSSSPSPSAPLLLLQVFPANDRPEQPPHDVRVSPATVEEAGCGAYGRVLLRLKNPQAKERPDHLHLPARLVPCHQVLPGHVVVAEAVMEALGSNMGSLVEIELAGPTSPSSSQPSVSCLYLMPLPCSSNGNNSSTAAACPPPAAVFHRILREIGVGVVAVGSILMVRFLYQTLGFQVVEVEVETKTTTGPQVGAATAGPRIIHVTKKGKETEIAPASSSSSFGSYICDEILEIADQNKHTGGQRLPQNLQMKGVLLSGPRGSGKSYLLQQLQQQQQDNKCICVIYVRGKNLVGPLLDGDDARVEEMLFHAHKGTGARAAATSFVLLLDDFDALLSGGGAATDTNDDDGMQGDDGEEDEYGNNRDAVRVLKALQRHLTGGEKCCCWVLATRQTLGGGGGKGGGPRQRWLASLQGVLFDKVMEVPVPTPIERSSILQALLRREREAFTSTERVAEMTGGFLPGDLDTLCQVAALKAMASGRQEAVTLADFLAARKEVFPAVLNGMARSSKQQQRKLSWECIGGYEDVKARLRKFVEWPMLYGETFARLGLIEKQSLSSSSSTMPLLSGGILFHGPSGCGKSLFARVLAAEVQANFVELPASEVFSAYLGDSEAKVRAAFARARRAAPCILFLDELDAMAAGRDEAGGDGDGTGGVYARVLSTLLNEMDGVSGQAQGLLVVAATNRRDAVDAALLRPGRLQESLLIPYPDPQRDYLSIFQVATRGMPLEKDLDLSEVAAAAAATGRREREGKAASPPTLTPANLVALCREAGLACLREADENETESDVVGDETLLVVRQRHFLQAVEKTLA